MASSSTVMSRGVPNVVTVLNSDTTRPFRRKRNGTITSAAAEPASPLSTVVPPG